MHMAWREEDDAWVAVGKVTRMRGIPKHAVADVDHDVVLCSKRYDAGEWTGAYHYIYTKSVWTNTTRDRVHGWRSFDFPYTRLCITTDGHPPPHDPGRR